MFGEHCQCLCREQASLACLLQVSRQLEVQARDTLVVMGVERRLDDQQVAAGRGRSLLTDDLAAQIGQVVANRTLLAPRAIGRDQARQRQGGQQSVHAKLLSAAASLGAVGGLANLAPGLRRYRVTVCARRTVLCADWPVACQPLHIAGRRFSPRLGPYKVGRMHFSCARSWTACSSAGRWAIRPA
ncbi:hypothetical protein D3C78_1173830 [compost metagenome]